VHIVLFWRDLMDEKILPNYDFNVYYCVYFLNLLVIIII
jgi:hypothetical protein